MKSGAKGIALTLFAVAMTVTAQKDSSSSPQGGDTTNRMKNVEWKMKNGGRGVAATSNILHSPFYIFHFSRSPFSILHLIERWSRRGAWKDGVRVNFDDDWCFPYGTEHLRSVELWAQGSVYPNAHDPMPIASLGVPLALKPGVSVVSYFRGADGAYVFDWVRGYPNRDAGNTLDGRIALCRNGDIAVTTNGVTEVHPRLPDFAQDGYGQCETWVRANFTNAEEIISTGYANWVDREIGTGLTNGLYRFTATFRSSPPEAIRLDVGELTVAVTNAGTYAFVLEKGLEYEFGTEPYFADVDYAAVDDIPSPRPSLQAAADWSTWTIDPGRLTLLLPEEWNYGFCSWTSVCSNCVGITVVEPMRIAVSPMSGRGLAVLRGTNLNMSVVCEPAGATIPLVQWFDAKMHADGTYTAWREYAERGMSISRTMTESGIFLLKAHTVFPGPQYMPVYFLRMQDDFLGPYEEGEHDRIGVASEQWQLDLCNAAAAQLGSTAYARNTHLPARNGFSEVLKDRWKCNAFVADMAISVGLSVPQQHISSNIFWTHVYPPVANEWANGDVSIAGWEYLGRSPWPEPGFIVGHPATSGSGHVGIVDYDGEGIGAGTTHVNRKYKFIDGTSGFNRYRGVESLNQSN